MEKDQLDKLNKLKKCIFLPGSYDKRFVRDMCAKPEDYQLSDKQSIFLEKLVYKYRRQITGQKK